MEERSVLGRPIGFWSVTVVDLLYVNVSNTFENENPIFQNKEFRVVL